jgi:D-alanyl-D-alanine carboxypeptidase
VHYEEMFDAAAAEGIYLTPVSGYRSYDTQVELYNNKINQMRNQGYSPEEAPIQAATIVMVPGSSEHNLGYAMDIVSLYESFDQTAEFDWLMENAEDYGFILRYPKGKEDITKVIYEPWHWRYVGVDTARKINASGLTLEEYYGKSAQ